MNTLHILNGDALSDHFPDIIGEKIVVRECLIEGNSTGETWSEFIAQRQEHIKTYYGEAEEKYQTKVVAEFKRIKQISDRSNVYFWFEDDLFCQVNFWFACSLMAEKAALHNLFFVRAKPTQQHGFGGMDDNELISAFHQAKVMQPADIKLFTKIWNAYKNKDIDQLHSLQASLSSGFSFVQLAIAAASKMTTHEGETFSYYDKLLLKIIRNQEFPNFSESFRLFSAHASILGLGDLQVKRMYEKLIHYV